MLVAAAVHITSSYTKKCETSSHHQSKYIKVSKFAENYLKFNKINTATDNTF